MSTNTALCDTQSSWSSFNARFLAGHIVMSDGDGYHGNKVNAVSLMSRLDGEGAKLTERELNFRSVFKGY